jgi:hypothetical protein
VRVRLAEVNGSTFVLVRAQRTFCCGNANRLESLLARTVHVYIIRTTRGVAVAIMHTEI